MHLVREYDDLTFEYSETAFRESNVVFLGRQLPTTAHSLRPFLRVLEKQFGDFWIFDGAEMTLRSAKQVMETSS